MKLTLNETAAFLAEQDHFLILTHRRPDGDTIGSAAALCHALRRLDKTAHLLDNPQITPKYRPYVEGLTVDACPDHACIIAVDTASVGLFPLSGLDLTERVDLCIDHHGSNTGYAARTLVQPEKAACGEIIAALLVSLGIIPDQTIAECLYVAIATDTGCFRYSNVTADTLRWAARLKDWGAETYPINKIMFETRRLPRLKLEAYLIQTLRLHSGGRIGICAIPWSLRGELGLTEDDLDDISGFARDIEGVEVGVMLRQQEDGGCKLSVRTSPGYDASAICALLGGGGHKAAAGAMFDGGIEETVTAILSAIRQTCPEL